MKDCAGKGVSVSNLIPRWVNLDNAVEYLKKMGVTVTPQELLTHGIEGAVEIYSIVPDDSYVQYWSINGNQCVLHQEEINGPIRIAPTKLNKILQLYPSAGYSLLIEAPLPGGCSYDLPEYFPIIMRMEGKSFSRGITISSHEALRVSGNQLDALFTELHNPEPVEAQGSKVVGEGAIKTYITSRNAITPLVIEVRNGCALPNDLNAVWNQLINMARLNPPRSPLIGFVPNEGIQYQGKKFYEDNGCDYYSKEALRAYINRNPL